MNTPAITNRVRHAAATMTARADWLEQQLTGDAPDVVRDLVTWWASDLRKYARNVAGDIILGDIGKEEEQEEWEIEPLSVPVPAEPVPAPREPVPA
jgi:hypothetical protein